MANFENIDNLVEDLYYKEVITSYEVTRLSIKKYINEVPEIERLFEILISLKDVNNYQIIDVIRNVFTSDLDRNFLHIIGNNEIPNRLQIINSFIEFIKDCIYNKSQKLILVSFEVCNCNNGKYETIHKLTTKLNFDSEWVDILKNDPKYNPQNIEFQSAKGYIFKTIDEFSDFLENLKNENNHRIVFETNWKKIIPSK